MAVSVAWQKNGSIVLQAVRELASARQSALLQLVRAGRRGRIELIRGEVTCIRAGRLEDVDAFQHLLLWGHEATIATRPSSSPSARTQHVGVDRLIEAGLSFLEQLDNLSPWLGVPASTFERVPRRLKDPEIKLPVEVRRFANGIEPGMMLVDLIDASTFRPIDTIKICFRLRELGVLVIAEPSVVVLGDRTERQALLDPARAAPAASPVLIEGKRRRSDSTSEITSRRAKVTRPIVPRSETRAEVKPRPAPPSIAASKTGRSSKVPRVDGPTGQSFDEVDEAFFAGAAELGPEAFVDRFEDLENTATREKLRKR